jgi:hypothetical protein
MASIEWLYSKVKYKNFDLTLAESGFQRMLRIGWMGVQGDSGQWIQC